MTTQGVVDEAVERSGESGPMRLEELLSLPATVNVVTAARALGISGNKAYDLLKRGEFPVRTLALGATVRVPTTALWQALGIGELPAVAAGLGEVVRGLLGASE